MPWVAPVTIATLFSNLMACFQADSEVRILTTAGSKRGGTGSGASRPMSMTRSTVRSWSMPRPSSPAVVVSENSPASISIVVVSKPVSEAVLMQTLGLVQPRALSA